MNIKLMALEIENFKGVKRFSTELAGNSATVEGDNGAGKTTLYDAFIWLLFGEDSLGQTNFNIKPMSENQAIHGLETKVEATLSIDGTTLVLLRGYKEKWTKSRGQEEKQLTGHESEFVVNGIPVKKNEYEDKINGLIDGATFKMLANASYFPGLRWDSRRKLLFDLFGDVNDAELLSDELSELKEYLPQYENIENYNKSLIATRKKLNQGLIEIPVRIDETSRELCQTRSLDVLQGERAKIEKYIAEKRSIKPNKHIEMQQAILRNMLVEIESLEQKKRDAFKEAKTKKEEQWAEDDKKLRDIVQLKRKVDNELLRIDNRIEDLDKELARLRSEWVTISESKIDGRCPTCGQPWPTERVEEFNLVRSRRLEEIMGKANEIKEQLSEMEKTKDKRLKDLSEIDKKIDMQTIANKNICKEIETMSFSMEGDKEYEDGIKAYENLKRDLQQRDIYADDRGIQVEVEKLSQELSEIQDEMAAVKQNEVLKERIKELSESERSTAKALQEVERQIYLCESYSKKKADAVTEMVNRHFERVSFQMFKTLINGGVEPCCEISYNGVLWDSLSYSERIKAGLEIIRAFQKAKGVYAPVFIDNRESITAIPEMECQVINLYKVDGLKQLSIKTEKQNLNGGLL